MAAQPAVAAYARAVGCADHARTGPRPLAEGSTIPGFRVAAADPGRELALTGRHRFSVYALTFRLDEEEAAAGKTVLRAESRAEFPGPHGRLYRLLVIGTGFHARAMRRMLSGISRGAGRS